jgi:predicted Holliday junction resolvase-like endonuclease
MLMLIYIAILVVFVIKLFSDVEELKTKVENIEKKLDG